MTKYVADTYAWIAYFNKKRFQEIIDNEVIHTPSIVVAELIRNLQKKGFDEQAIQKIIDFVIECGPILSFDLDHAIKAPYIMRTENLAFADGIIYTYIQDADCCLLTGDEHFKGKKQVLFEKE